MKFLGREFTFNGLDIFHRGNFNPDEKVSKGEKIVLPPSTTTEASISIPHGSTPNTPTNGDLWTTSTGPMMRVNGTTRTLYHSGNASTAALSTATQSEAETGTSITVRAWTPQRIRQAITAALPTKLSDLVNDIGAGGGNTIIVSKTQPSVTKPGDFWYEEV